METKVLRGPCSVGPWPGPGRGDNLVKRKGWGLVCVFRWQHFIVSIPGCRTTLQEASDAVKIAESNVAAHEQELLSVTEQKRPWLAS